MKSNPVILCPCKFSDTVYYPGYIQYINFRQSCILIELEKFNSSIKLDLNGYLSGGKWSCPFVQYLTTLRGIRH
jgi:hypothetical protein